MTYQQLPESLKQLYQVAFNSAFQCYGDETKAHETAWRAVRSQLASPTSLIDRRHLVADLNRLREQFDRTLLQTA